MDKQNLDRVSFFILSLIFIFLMALISASALTEQQLNSQEPGTAKASGGTVYDIVLVGVTEKGDACGISVNGMISWIEVDQEDTINGLRIKVLKALPVRNQLKDKDVCHVFLYGVSDYSARPAADETQQRQSEQEPIGEAEENEKKATNEEIKQEIPVDIKLYKSTCQSSKSEKESHFGRCDASRCGDMKMVDCVSRSFLWLFKRSSEICMDDYETHCAENPECDAGYSEVSKAEC